MKKSRQEEYNRILKQMPALNQGILNTIEHYETICGQKMQMSTQLYLTVFAPALIGFVNWVLEESDRQGKNRIYFLSRDGYQMYLIAKKLMEVKGSTIDCRYLNVSRFSMRIPGYHLNIENSIDSICVGGVDVTPLKILKRGGLTQEECEAVLEEVGCSEFANSILNYSKVLQFKQQLKKSKQVRIYIKHHSNIAYKEAAEYLKQENLCLDNNYFLVDSGWIGTLQCSIETLVKSIQPEIEINGCYFGMYEYPKNVGEHKFNTYYFSPKSGLKQKSTFANSLFETVVSSKEGMTMGYCSENGQYIPIFNKNENPNQVQMEEQIKVLKLLLEQPNLNEISNTIEKNKVQQLFELCMAKPTKEEVHAFGNYLFSDDVIDGNYKTIAAELTWEEIKNQRFINKLMIVLGIKKAIIYESAWLEGSAVKAGNKKQYQKEFYHIRFYKNLMYLRKQIKKK